MVDLVINTSITHSLLLVLPVLAALLLRSTRCAGWSVLGGALAGVLLGPSVMGRLMPESFERGFVGGIEQRVSLEETLGRHRVEMLAATEAGSAAEARAGVAERHATEVRAAEEAWREAQWSHQRPLRSLTVSAVVVVLLGAGLRATGGGRPASLVAAGSIGVWSAALPAAIAYACMVKLWQHPPATALLAAAAVAIGPWVLTDVDAQAADRAEYGGARTVEAAGRVASVLALLAAAAAMFLQRGATGLAWAAPLAALPIGWGLGRLLPTARDAGWLRAALDLAFVPCLAASVTLKIEVSTHFALASLIVFILLSGDGRWLGAFIGAMLPGGRRGIRTMRLVLGVMACGPTQLAVTAIAIQANLLPATIGFALLAGAVLVEVITPARRRMAERLESLEEEA